MRNKIKLQFILLFAGCLGFVACSDNEGEGNGKSGLNTGELPVNIRLSNSDLPENTRCTMYMFGKNNGDSDYILKDSFHLSAENRRILPYVESEWENTDYRFLFIAFPSEDAGMVLSNDGYSDLTREVDEWSKVRIKAADTKTVSGDCYFGVLDKTKAEIDGSRIISGEIKRLVGQMAIDIFRVGDNGAPMDKVNPKIASVIDRVFRIDFEYSGLTNEISFDNDGEPKWETTSGLTKTSMDIQLADTLQMNLVDNEVLGVSSEEVEGSIRIKNLFCLPSVGNITLKVIFNYYDTTPACGDVNHAHTAEAGCYVEKALTLNLPQNSNEREYLDILPNFYTVNKAGIPMDRIIDLNQTGSFGLNTTWENR